MVRSMAWCLVVTLVLGSGRLLACDWECGDAAAAAVEVACHHESPGGPLIGGVAHECPPQAVEPIVAATQKAEKHAVGAFHAASPSISHVPRSFGARAFLALNLRAVVPHPLPINVLRI